MEPETPPNQDVAKENPSPETNKPVEIFADVPETTVGRKVPVSAQLGVLLAIMLAIFGAPTFNFLMSQFSFEPNSQAAVVPEVNHENIDDSLLDPFAHIAVSARSVYVLDVQNRKVLYKKNPDQQLPLASVTKLMTALVASEIVGQSDTVPISTTAILQDGDNGLLAGEKFTLEELLDLTLMSSSNDGAFAIASAAGALLSANEPAKNFVEAMNIRATELGLTQTYFRNPTGLDVSENEAGAYGSAKDIAMLMEYILRHEPEILERTKDDAAVIINEAGAYHEATNTNEVVNDIPGIIGSKTGYTDLSGGNLAVAFDAGFDRPVVVVVLGSTRSQRFSDVLTLVDAARLAVK